MRTVVSIEARMRSTRLPGKVLLPLMGKPMLEMMIERVRRSQMVDDIVIATTMHVSCDPIEELARRLGVICYRGSEMDVLVRVYQAVVTARADTVIVLTGDMPLIDPALIDKVTRAFYESGVDYCANSLIQTYPRGMGVQVMKLAVLEDAVRNANDAVHHEHATMYIRENPERFRHLNVRGDFASGTADIRLCVDTPEDYELIRRTFDALYPNNPAFTLEDMLAYYRTHSELLALNRHVQQKQVR